MWLMKDGHTHSLTLLSLTLGRMSLPFESRLTFDCSDQWGIVEIYYTGSRSSLKRIDNFQLGF